MGLRGRLTIAFTIILLSAIVPITVFTIRVAPFKGTLLENANIERALESALANARTQEEKTSAMEALSEYRQLAAIKQPIEREFIRFSIILIGSLFLLAMAIVFISVNYITKPLKELTSATKKIAEGNTSVSIRPSKMREFNALINSFNYMAHSLDEAQDKLRLTERHAAWREMARMLAHEIKNQLTPIQLSTQRLREKYIKNSPDLPQVIDKTTKVIESEVNNFVMLVDKFSEFAKFPAPTKEPVSINTIVHESVSLYANIEKVKFEEHYDESIPEIMADPAQIKQAISNIVKNAIEAFHATHTNPVIRVTTSMGLINQTTTEVEIIVEDNGKGIPQEDLGRLFHPYWTTKEGGSGLGLVITERIIAEHGGKISVQSKEGEGTTVSIKLPLQRNV